MSLDDTSMVKNYELKETFNSAQKIAKIFAIISFTNYASENP